MTTRKVIQGRNPRLSLENDEIEFIKALIEHELDRNQKFDRKKLLFMLKLLEKFEHAK